MIPLEIIGGQEPLYLRIIGKDHLFFLFHPTGTVGPLWEGKRGLMLQIAQDCDGVGLAANQIGLSQSFFVNRLENIPTVIINPKIVSSKGSQTAVEGCLSFPLEECRPQVTRPKEIKVAFETEKRKKKLMYLRGWEARVFCHEIDHLKGRTLLDYVDKDVRDKLVEEYRLERYLPEGYFKGK